MTDSEDPQDELPDGQPDQVDDLFTAAGQGTGPHPVVEPATQPESSPYPDEPEAVDSPYPDEPEGTDSPYPDGPGTDVAVSGGGVMGDLFGRRERAPNPPLAPIPEEPPPAYPSGPTGRDSRPYPSGPAAYPAGPAQFGRRAPQGGPRPDAEGLYPNDYYVGPDWMRTVVRGLVAAIVVVGAVAAGTWLYDNYAPTNVDDEDEAFDATPTPLPLVAVFECAGDPEPVSEMVAPAPVLIAGRTADSRWLAFLNPQAPPRQLWVRASVVPEFNPVSVGLVSCAGGPDEFPTPIAVPTPVPTISADPTPTPLASEG